MNCNKPKTNDNKKSIDKNKKPIDKNNFLEFCHFLYDELHGKEKVNQIFDIDILHINNMLQLYKTNFIWRENKIFNYINGYVNIRDTDYNVSLFYVNAFQHYLEK